MCGDTLFAAVAPVRFPQQLQTVDSKPDPLLNTTSTEDYLFKTIVEAYLHPLQRILEGDHGCTCSNVIPNSFCNLVRINDFTWSLQAISQAKLKTLTFANDNKLTHRGCNVESIASLWEHDAIHEPLTLYCGRLLQASNVMPAPIGAKLQTKLDLDSIGMTA